VEEVVDAEVAHLGLERLAQLEDRLGTATRVLGRLADRRRR
jgi:hypothetical protein